MGSSSPKFSIIVPIYNVELYLEDCFQSVLDQSFQSYELICVNDGSTDSSLEILKSFNDHRIKILDQINQGQSVARNAALDIASGEYVWFVDSDDKIAENSLLELDKILRQQSYEMVFFNAKVFFETIELEKKGWHEYKRVIYGETNSLTLFESEMANGGAIVSPCCYVFKREVFNNIRYIPNIYHEDNPFYMELIFSNPTSSCYVLDKELFLRRVRSGSVMTSEKPMKHAIGYLVAIEYLLEYKKIKKINNTSYDKLIARLIDPSLFILKGSKCPEFKLNMKKYKKLPGLSFKKKLACNFPWLFSFYLKAKRGVKK
ncbi:TPA: glycosyltransferase [Klebsiella pneumoniae]|nr:glycosyltransferase [Klebsiella pneumoniae]